jgi:hypothetical protein
MMKGACAKSYMFKIFSSKYNDKFYSKYVYLFAVRRLIKNIGAGSGEVILKNAVNRCYTYSASK